MKQDRFTEEEGWIEGAEISRQSVTPHWDMHRDLITGVAIKEVKPVPTHYGWLKELYRSDWQLDRDGVDGVFQAALEPGAVSAWHAHIRTTDRLFIVEGMARIVLFDARKGSPTHGRLNDDLVFGQVRPALVVIPPGVWHGVRNVSSRTASLVNILSRAYSYEEPDHLRLPPDTDAIPYHGFRDGR